MVSTICFAAKAFPSLERAQQHRLLAICVQARKQVVDQDANELGGGKEKKLTKVKARTTEGSNHDTTEDLKQK